MIRMIVDKGELSLSCDPDGHGIFDTWFNPDGIPNSVIQARIAAHLRDHHPTMVHACPNCGTEIKCERQ